VSEERGLDETGNDSVVRWERARSLQKVRCLNILMYEDSEGDESTRSVNLSADDDREIGFQRRRLWASSYLNLPGSEKREGEAVTDRLPCVEVEYIRLGESLSRRLK